MDSSEEEDVIIALLLRRRKKRKSPRWWVHPLNQLRTQQGAYENLVREMRNDSERFLNFHRLTPDQFDFLLRKVEPHIAKLTYLREPLSAGLRLSLTLRYMASGDSMISLSYLYRVGYASVSKLVKKTARVIWMVLQPDMLPPVEPESLVRIAHDFGDLWDFPQCSGAIDGKHVVCQAPNRSGSRNFNYKGTFSVVLMAVCDAQYRFIYVSTGSAGRESDGGIFNDSSFRTSIENRTLPLPPPRAPTGSNIILPPVIVGDAAFPLKDYLMKPYGGHDLPPEKVIFNYRLSRARRVIENTFGILAVRWRVFRKPIIASLTTIDSVVLACAVLHNWLRDVELRLPAGQRRYVPPDFVDRVDRNGGVIEVRWRDDGQPQGLNALPGNPARNSPTSAKDIRQRFTQYFMSDGCVPWQWDKLPEHERDVYRQRAEQHRLQ